MDDVCPWGSNTAVEYVPSLVEYIYEVYNDCFDDGVLPVSDIRTKY